MLRLLTLRPLAELLLAASAKKSAEPGFPEVLTSDSAKNLVSASVLDTINGMAVD